MKKALSLLLALVMCLSLCACSEDAPNGTTTATEDDTEKQARYDYALSQLEASKTDYSDPSSLVKEAYDILTALDGFMDAEKYLQQITIIQDVCICIEAFQTNAFGEKVNQCEYPRGYDSKSRLSWFGDHKEYNPDFVTNDSIVYINCYDNNNRVASVTKYICTEGRQRTSTITTNQYDESGRIVAETIQCSDGSTIVNKHEYNAAGQCIKSLYRFSYEEFKYDESGYKIEMVSYWGNVEEYVEKYYYNDSGIIQTVGQAKGATGFKVTEYVYDTGRIVAEKHYSASNLENPNDWVVREEYNYVYGDYYCYTPAE